MPQGVKEVSNYYICFSWRFHCRHKFSRRGSICFHHITPLARLHCATMLRAVFRGCALIFLALFASAISDFGAEKAVVENAQLPLRYDARLVCHSISRNISPASQVFYPGAVLLSFAETLAHQYHLCPQSLPNLRKISLTGPTRAHRYPRAPCGLAQQRTSA